MNDYLDNDILINGKYYNTENVFHINPYRKLKIEKFLGYTIIVVDDFYTNPDLVRDIALSSTATKHKNWGYPGFRSSFWVDQTFNLPIYEKIIKSVFPELLYLNDDTLNEINFNLTKSSDVHSWNNKLGNNACGPHKDLIESVPISFGSVIFLNKEKEFDKDKNGTGFYRHIPTDIIDCNHEVMDYYNKDGYEYSSNPVNDVFFRDSRLCDDWINDGNKYWEMVHLTNMKYNRMVLYPASYFHATYYNNNNFKDTDSKKDYRIVQASFLRGEENNIDV